jgi:dsRNA-specific ribonuclease
METDGEQQKGFLAKVLLDGKAISSGQGQSKKDAEQNAAREALKKIAG